MTVCFKEGCTHKKMKAPALDHPDAVFDEGLLAGVESKSCPPSDLQKGRTKKTAYLNDKVHTDLRMG